MKPFKRCASVFHILCTVLLEKQRAMQQQQTKKSQVTVAGNRKGTTRIVRSKTVELFIEHIHKSIFSDSFTFMTQFRHEIEGQ